MDGEGERKALPLRPGWESVSFPRSLLPSVPGPSPEAPLDPLYLPSLAQTTVAVSSMAWPLRPRVPAALGAVMMAKGQGAVGREDPAGGSLGWGHSHSREPVLGSCSQTRCSMCGPSPEGQGTQADGGDSGSVLREPQSEGKRDTGSSFKWPVIIFFTTPIMILIFSLHLFATL